MPAYTNPKRIFKYSDEFKLKAVQWSFDPQRSVKEGKRTATTGFNM